MASPRRRASSAKLSGAAELPRKPQASPGTSSSGNSLSQGLGKLRLFADDFLEANNAIWGPSKIFEFPWNSFQISKNQVTIPSSHPRPRGYSSKAQGPGSSQGSSLHLEPIRRQLCGNPQWRRHGNDPPWTGCRGGPWSDHGLRSLQTFEGQNQNAVLRCS